MQRRTTLLSRAPGSAGAVAALAALLLGACIFVHAEDGHAHYVDEQVGARDRKAVAQIEGRSGVPLSGKATFTEVAGGVEVRIHVRNAPPGVHAVHVHEVGDCSAPDGTSAGGHFNPGGHEHGAPHALAHHAGDLGNMWVDEDGEGHHLVLMPELTVAPGDHSVVGRSIIVHELADDLATQPTGAAGGRIGCGVIH